MSRRACGLLVFFILTLGASAPASAMSEAELQELYLGVVEDAVNRFEPLWRDASDRIPDSGYFDFSRYGNWRDDRYAGIITVPGNGMVVFCYAVLLTQTDRQTFTDQEIPRRVLFEHARKTLRWIALTSVHTENQYSYLPYASGGYIKNRKWWRPPKVRADMQGWLTVGVALLRDRLDPELRQLLETALVGEVFDKYPIYAWTPHEGGLHDKVKHLVSNHTAGAFLYPDRPEGRRAMDYLSQAGVDIVATRHDRACNRSVAGRPVREWAHCWNLYQDYSSDHHGHSQVWYGCDLLFEARIYMALLGRITGQPVPETWTYPGNGFEGVLDWVKQASLPEGEPAPVHGAEYDSYYGAGLLAFCYGALIEQDPVAAALEDQAARLLKRQSRAVGQYDYHRNSWAKAAAAYLMHRYAGPRVEPLALEEARARLRGSYHYRSQMALLHRGARKWVSFAWGNLPRRLSRGHCGVLSPQTRPGRDRDPLVYVHPDSMMGRIEGDWLDAPKQRHRAPEYSYFMSDCGFHTGGVRRAPALDRYRAFFSFPDGPCVAFTRFLAYESGSFGWTGFPIYFYVRDGMTCPRALFTAEGRRPLEDDAQCRSSWWSVDGRLGLFAAGGNGHVTVSRSPGYNWARIPEYRDKCDSVSVGRVPKKQIRAGDVPVDLTVALYPNAPHEVLARCARSAQRRTLKVPSGWKGEVVPAAGETGRRFLALARFDGASRRSEIDLSFPEGAPVLDVPTRIRGSAARAVIGLDHCGTYAQELSLYVTVSDGRGVVANRETRFRYRVAPVEGSADLVLAYAGGEGSQLKIRPEKGPGEARELRLDGDGRFRVEIAGLATIAVADPTRRDGVGPAVEISDVDVRADGRVHVRVRASDQSGVAKVGLRVDGENLGDKAEQPYSWVFWPGRGFHTLQATARDGAPAQNERASFKRTIEVRPGYPPF